ncbi:copper homeostasis protein CutC [Enterococcus columbae]|uniref:PF03932 family protein CutC n=1 Tax=Enterococcus columbae DSM 7374 = ATCC 51263 TaxID=1121865 RepID=S0KJ78_9ENTE|nr:copper homeostasis protein CutC [Enterococcus columbae]EOT41020.1 copper homeostasis protein CutC [Enterococcus columbae DSM 7374 = ATCC 51263]EOW80700.1 copper homeostasis protein CutC [Enterococcus columbae DSM 7374 = ATCC 51263]OJG21354.1 copper homeostasis protein CutC [Enterococcus columbae DSM 7374 = ATCC 51263]
MSKLIKEFCAENYTDIPLAIHQGANRIELCDNLAVGGTTPSTGVIEEALSYAGEKHIPVMVMIRPRKGDFIYNDIELKIMHTDLIEAKKLGVDGVVFGCLTPSGWLDEEALETLIEASEGLEITFHMAFDQIPKEMQFTAIDWLVEHGVSRILTHGGPLSTPIEENIAHLAELIHYANQRLTILPGGGITYQNAEEIANKLGIHEVHGSNIVKLD